MSIGNIRGHEIPLGKPCFFLKIGGNCGDYDNRPQQCKAYKCLWLEDESVPDYMKPENSNAILDIGEIDGIKYLRLSKSGAGYDSKVLNYAKQYAKDHQMSLVYYDDKNNFCCEGDSILGIKVRMQYISEDAIPKASSEEGKK